MVPDFGSVKFLLSISSMNHLNSVIDVSARQISIRKKSFVFKTSFHNRVKAHDPMTIGIKCSLPKQLRNGNFIAKPLCQLRIDSRLVSVCKHHNTPSP